MAAEVWRSSPAEHFLVDPAELQNVMKAGMDVFSVGNRAFFADPLEKYLVVDDERTRSKALEEVANAARVIAGRKDSEDLFMRVCNAENISVEMKERCDKYERFIIPTLKSQLEGVKEELVSLRLSHSSLDVKNKILTERNEGMLKAYGEISAQVARLTRVTVEQQTNNTSLSSKVEKLEREVAALKQQITILTQFKDHWEATSAHFEARSKRLESEVQQLNAKTSNDQLRELELSRKIEELESQAEKQQSQVEKQQARLRALESKRLESELNAKTSNDQLRELELSRKIEELERQLQSQDEKQQARLRALELKFAALRS